jgi:hypothetical protein
MTQKLRLKSTQSTRAPEINARIGGPNQIAIHADTPRLDSPILAPRAATTLIARKVITGPHTTINVSGVTALTLLRSALRRS